MELSYFETVSEAGDVSYSRPKTKSLEALKVAIELNIHINDINRFISMYIENVQWDWFDKYNEYLSVLESTTVFNENLPVISIDEDGNDVFATIKELPSEPIRPELITVEEFKDNNVELFDSYNKKQGINIGGYVISLNKDNTDGLVTIKSGYEMFGDDLFPTNFLADTPTGTVKIPMNDYTAFNNFAMEFLVARSSLFK